MTPTYESHKRQSRQYAPLALQLIWAGKAEHTSFNMVPSVW
jgi:hypothetical protein